MADSDYTSSNTSSKPGSSTDSRSEETRKRARETASEVKDAAWQQARGQFEQQSSLAAEQTEKLAAVLRKMANEFDNQNQPAFSSFANNFARYSDSISHQLREKNLSGLMNDAQRYSRRQPAIFVGGAIAVGFLAARFLRSSDSGDTAHRRTEATSSPPSPTSPSPTSENAASDAAARGPV